MVEQINIQFPGKLVFGKHCLSRLNTEILEMNPSAVLIITIEPLLISLQDLLNDLRANDITVEVDTSIIREPSFEDFEILLISANIFNPDIVIGIGGGSVLDIAKLLAALIGNKQKLQDIVGIGLLKNRPKKLICLPATSGTGSEVSPNAILVDNKDNQKKGIISPFLVPDIVYVDPLLTMSVPPGITASTGLDALTHCLEAYTNKFSHPFIDMYAYEGMRLIAANLVKAVEDGFDEDARTNVAMGSLLGGFCLGPVNTAAVHALSYPLGSTFHLAHGLTNALLLPYVMEYNLPASIRRYASVAIALGCQHGKDEEQTAKEGIEKIKSLLQECNIPSRLRDVGIPETAIPQLAEEAMKIQRLLKNNPRTIELEDAVKIFKAAY